jgi:hypothetical protein
LITEQKSSISVQTSIILKNSTLQWRKSKLEVLRLLEKIMCMNKWSSETFLRTKVNWERRSAKNFTRLIILYRDDEKVDFSNTKRRLIENFLNNLILMSSSMTTMRWKNDN